MPHRIKCSVGIITRNAGANLRRALESVRDFDEIVICDGGSTDDTLEIAREFGARIVPQPADAKGSDGRLIDFGKARQVSLEAARNDWFLYIDADETISDGLRSDIARITQGALGAMQPSVYRIPLGIIMDGRVLKHSSNFPGYQTRFFHKASDARFVKPVHEKAVFATDAIIGTVGHPWYIHTTMADWQTYISDTRSYRALAFASHRAASFSRRTRVAYRCFKSAFGICIRTLIIRIRHGGRDAVPLAGEWGRFCDQMIVGIGILFPFSQQWINRPSV